MDITHRGDGLDISRGGLLLAHVLPEAKDRFFDPKFPDIKSIFVRDGSGAIQWFLPKRYPSSPERGERVRN